MSHRVIPDINTIKSIADLGNLEIYAGFKSPDAWRDQVMYFLLPDRFSDGEEANRPMFDYMNVEEYKTQDKKTWMDSGKVFQGGTIKGIESKLDYLKNLGITTLWLGPVFKQRKDLETYHGYGVQNFFDVDPRFGSRKDLVELVAAAHEKDIYVVLDIIYNHTGNNWFYFEDHEYKSQVDYRYEPKRDLEAWRSYSGQPVQNIHTDEDGVWPRDFQNHGFYTRAGKIGNWDPAEWEDPLHKDTEFRRGDFFDLKDLDLDKKEVVEALIRVYQYWIGLTDCDGFRIDTVKHVPFEVSRIFCGAIHEYAECLGKDNFLLLGEITGGARMSKDYLEMFGRNIDAVLDIGYPTEVLKNVVKGQWDPKLYFNQFTSRDTLGTHREIGRYHVSILDDHDKVGATKERFTAYNTILNKYQQVAHAVGVQLTTLGIPCVYYGTEQGLDGNAGYHDENIEALGEDGKAPFEDRYIRESMFGSTFGGYETSGCHFFNENHPAYKLIGAIAKLRNNNDLVGVALRRGRQYQRETSFLDKAFSYPENGELIAWSRIIGDTEVLVVLNSMGTQMRGAHICLHRPFHPVGSTMDILYRSDFKDLELETILTRARVSIPVEIMGNNRSTVYVELPPAGMAILA